MSDTKKVVSSIWDSEPEDLVSKAGGKFGLNVGHITKLEFITNAGAGGSEGNAVDFAVEISGRNYNRRFFLNENIYYKNELIGPEHEEYAKAFVETYRQDAAVFKHALSALGVSKDSIKKLPVGTTEGTLLEIYIEDVKKLLSLLPTDYATKPVDIFLEYQYSIPEGQTRTFPTLPKNMKGGVFLVPHVNPVGAWTEFSTEEEGLYYVDEAGNRHPFTRSVDFMESTKGKQQDLNAKSNSAKEESAREAGW